MIVKHAKLIIMIASALFLAGPSTFNFGAPSKALNPKIDTVYLAQYHVLEPSDPYFKLVGDLEALIKVQVYSYSEELAPHVYATVQLGEKTRDIRLRGPKVLPKPPTGDPVWMTHAYDDSFTAMIPREWIRPGLTVSVELRDYDYVTSKDDKDYVNCNPRNEVTVLDSRVLKKLNIGAPTNMVMYSFDINYFGLGKAADYPKGWEAEMEAKLPVSELDIRRVRNIVFDEIVIPPGAGLPPARITSAAELAEAKATHEKKTKWAFSHQLGFLGYKWAAALKRAGSGRALFRTYCVNSAGVHSSGRGGGYVTGNHLHRRGMIFHELGHAYGLPHWMGHKEYPYQRTMYGWNTGQAGMPNAGPKWGFNLNTREFLPPYAITDGKVQRKDGKVVWIHDPMHGGGRSRHTNSVYTHYSDYSIHKMQQRIETKGVVWNDATETYAMWNQETGAYDKVVANDGLKLPLVRDTEVISVMATANATVPAANIVYPPIGPYESGLVRLFDANSKADRDAAMKLGYSAKTCNVALRITQRGKATAYLLRIAISAKDKHNAFNVTAINLPAKDGEVTKAELIHCPDVMAKGVTPDSKVLYVWRMPE